MLCLVILQ